MLIRPMMFRASVAGVDATAFNPADSSPDWSFSNNNRTALRAVSGTNGTAARGGGFVSSGKRYAEFLVDNNAGGLGICISNASYDPKAGGFPGNTNTGIRYVNGSITFAGSGRSGFPVHQAGDVIGMAIDREAGTLDWYRNGAYLTSSPEIPPGPVALTVASQAIAGNQATIRTTAGSFAYSPPSGFSPWS